MSGGAALKGSMTACLHRILARSPHPGELAGRGDLGGGSAGLAVAFASLHGRQPDRGFRERALAHLEQACGALQQVPMGPGLLGGVAGIAWAHGQVLETLGENPREDPCGDLDEALEAHVRSAWPGPTDLGAGLAGIGVYALARARRGRSPRLLEATLEALQRRAFPSGGEGPWPTGPNHLPSFQLQEAPQGYCNLGLAHGMPGILALLGRTIGSGWAGAGLGALLGRAMAWTLEQRNPPGSPSSYGFWIPRGETPAQRRERGLRPTRVAWCYGDLGAGTGLLQGALGTGDLGFAEAALEVCRQAAARPVAGSGVMDGGFCHGAAGNAHLCRRLYQATGEPLFLEACVAWLNEVLAFERLHGAFHAWQPESGGEGGSWVLEPGLLAGEAGVALVLADCLGQVEGSWDGFLMTDLHPGA